MSAPLVTRPFLPEDYDLVLPLWRESEGVEVAEGDDRATIGAYLARNPGLSRLAFVGPDLAGAVLCGHDGRRGLLYHLAVRPTHRGRGVGRQVVQECLGALRACGVPRVLLLVAAENDGGLTFWQALGFEAIDGARAMGLDLA
jgi:ribosomal protein S18 acetylase RimI-like enzyme